MTLNPTSIRAFFLKSESSLPSYTETICPYFFLTCSFKPLTGSTPRHIFVYACPLELGSSLQQNLSDFGLIPTMSSMSAGRTVKDNLKAALSSQPLDDGGHPIPFEVMLIFPEAGSLALSLL